ncbi:MAG: NAD-dependent epimerase/dehydratase family protein [Planctomycetota bacterium]
MHKSYGGDGAVWQGRRVLVLGASGFLGRRVARFADRLGCEVHGAVRDPARAGVSAELHAVDLGREREVAGLLARVRPDVVLDLAGYGVRREDQDAELAERVNARLPQWIVRAWPVDRRSDWKGAQVVRAGSASAECRPTTLYGRTKLAGTRALASAAAETGVRALTARLFHVYGPGERLPRLFPSLVRAAREGGDLALSSGTQQHDFAFVDDVAESLLRLAASSARPGEVVHVATGRLTSVREFALTAARILGLDESRLRFGEPAGEMSHGTVSIARLLELCGEAPSADLEDGIARAVRELEHEWAS